MALINHLEYNEDEGIFQTEDDSWIKHLNTQWDTRFKQCEPLMDDKLLQINLGNKEHPKSILISESLSPSKKEKQLQVIREYINVFALRRYARSRPSSGDASIKH